MRRTLKKQRQVLLHPLNPSHPLNRFVLDPAAATTSALEPNFLGSLRSLGDDGARSPSAPQIASRQTERPDHAVQRDQRIRQRHGLLVLCRRIECRVHEKPRPIHPRVHQLAVPPHECGTVRPWHVAELVRFQLAHHPLGERFGGGIGGERATPRVVEREVEQTRRDVARSRRASAVRAARAPAPSAPPAPSARRRAGASSPIPTRGARTGAARRASRARRAGRRPP